MQKSIAIGHLNIAPVLHTFINEQVLPDTRVSPDHFWSAFEALLIKLTPQNKALLKTRDNFQKQLDDWYQQQPDISTKDTKAFLTDIGYLVTPPDNVQITTSHVDDEIARNAGPQLVVPINNARYALNAVNARWGSLYDAFYGTDVIDTRGSLAPGKQYNTERGQAVIEKAKQWLDDIIPLEQGSHLNVNRYQITNHNLLITLSDGTTSTLKNTAAFKGYQGETKNPSALLFEHNRLHFELQIDGNAPIGKTDTAGINDILIESALTTIMDCEDSVAAVDAQDKTQVYKNWLGLMRGDLQVDVTKNGKTHTRSMNPDRVYNSANNGESLTLKGRSLMFIRNVGHLMQNDAILLNDEPVFEGLMDAMITACIALHDIDSPKSVHNSQCGSVYIVKPKMHGPEEVAFTHTLFSQVEQALGLPVNTLKMGIMDEERRTSLNLQACIAQANSRVVFINTGFLDRTGDEIHSSMHAGAFAPKADLKNRPWIAAYEQANVATGLHCGLSGKAQIGKGMWPMPDKMHAMMDTKIAHLEAGANTAWVPSPTAATLHALHYHQVDVMALHSRLHQQPQDYLPDMLTLPLLDQDSHPDTQTCQRELDNNVQGILGYVVRWVHQGIGCSKVPDIDNVGLMEDRATLRISSQHIANWLLHNVVSKQQVEESLERMAKLVDNQNQHDPNYIPMTTESGVKIGFNTARDLIFEGTRQPNGYTEPLLHERRKQMKQYLQQHSDSARI
ncbi:malate synthase G [Alteromonas lipotrueiana]|uniref:malate synthase G n=1 Tax=Alteromonas lipotrueiana TaxID=2803815 RepID=UPI001C4964C1|nr:malate synthase G [Alteromonas lipotrueiana]